MFGGQSIFFLNDEIDSELFAVFHVYFSVFLMYFSVFLMYFSAFVVYISVILMYFSVFVVYHSGSNGCQSLEELLGVYNPCPRLSDLWHQTEIEKLKKL